MIDEQLEQKFKMAMVVWATLLVSWVLLALSMQAANIVKLTSERTYLRERLFTEMSLRQASERAIERQTQLHSVYEQEIVSLKLQAEMLRVDSYIAKVNRSLPQETRWRIVLAVYNCAAIERVDPVLGLAVMEQESRFKPQARSVKDARGLMQLLPSTAVNELGIPISQIYSIETNICGGLAYLSRHLRRYDGVQTAALQRYYGGGEEWEYPRPVLDRYQRILKEVRR